MFLKFVFNKHNSFTLGSTFDPPPNTNPFRKFMFFRSLNKFQPYSSLEDQNLKPITDKKNRCSP